MLQRSLYHAGLHARAIAPVNVRVIRSVGESEQTLVCIYLEIEQNCYFLFHDYKDKYYSFNFIQNITCSFWLL